MLADVDGQIWKRTCELIAALNHFGHSAPTAVTQPVQHESTPASPILPESHESPIPLICKPAPIRWLDGQSVPHPRLIMRQPRPCRLPQVVSEHPAGEGKAMLVQEITTAPEMRLPVKRRGVSKGQRKATMRAARSNSQAHSRRTIGVWRIRSNFA